MIDFHNSDLSFLWLDRWKWRRVHLTSFRSPIIGSTDQQSIIDVILYFST